jgi:hypothetical protein
MAHSSTPEAHGNYILTLCKKHQIRPQEQFLPQVLRLSLLDPDLLPETLLAGLQWLLDHGYLEERGPLRTSYGLTAKGFAELSGSSAP